MWNRLSHFVVWVIYSTTFFGIMFAVWGSTLAESFSRLEMRGRAQEVPAMAGFAMIAGWLALELTTRGWPRLLRRPKTEQADDYDDESMTPPEA